MEEAEIRAAYVHRTSKRPELPTCPASPLRPERPGALLDQVSLAAGASPQQ